MNRNDKPSPLYLLTDGQIASAWMFALVALALGVLVGVSVAL